MKMLNVGGETSHIDVKEGDAITVIAGVWKDTAGIVKRVDEGKQSVTINVEMFGRETPVEIGFSDIKKM